MLQLQWEGTCLKREILTVEEIPKHAIISLLLSWIGAVRKPINDSLV